MADNKDDLLSQAQAVQKQKLLEQAQSVQNSILNPPDDRDTITKIKDYVTAEAVNQLPIAGSIAGQAAGAVGGLPGEALGAGVGNIAGNMAKTAIEDYKQGGLAQVLRPPTVSGTIQAAKDEASQLMGGVNQALGSKVIGSAMHSAGDYFRQMANTKAFKAAGAMLKDFRTASAKGDIQDVGRFMLDNGLVRAGDTVENVAQKSAQLKQVAGDKLNQVYSEANNAIQNLTPEQAIHLNSTGFNPVRDKGEILSSASERLGDSVEGKAAITKLSNYMDELGSKYGDNVLDPRTSNNIKSAMDDAINYSRNPMTKMPDVEKAFSSARKYVSGAIDDHLEALGDATGNPAYSDALKKANLDYGYSSQVSKMAQDKLNREMANRMFGLTEAAAGGHGGITGGIIGYAMGHPAEGAALGSVVGGAGSKLARTYGPAAMAGGADSLANLLSGGSNASPILGAPLGEISTPNPLSIIAPQPAAAANEKKRPILSTTIIPTRDLK